MASEVVDASHRMLTIHVPLEDVKEEVKGDSSQYDETSPEKRNNLVISNPSQANNNAIVPAGTHDVRIKEEPIDIDETETFEIKTDTALTIKAEPRAGVSDDNDDGAEEAEEIDVGNNLKGDPNIPRDDEDSDKERDDDEDIDDDDFDDLDFELDSLDDPDSPDSWNEEDDFASGRGSSTGSNLSLDTTPAKEEKNLEGGGVKIIEEGESSSNSSKSSAVTSSFEIAGLRIVSRGNYSRCPKCKKDIKSTFIIRHIKLHDVPIEKYECPEKSCGLQVNRINNLFRHLKVVHKSQTPYICKYCKKRYARAEELRTHFASHKAERERHRRTEKMDRLEDDGESRIYSCEFPGCGKEYKKRHHLKEHERKHTGDMKYKCEVCGKRFYIQAHMKRHLYSHTGIKPHVCRWKCGAIFASYGGRMKHERINHYDENPLQSECDICARPFKNTQQLAKHRMTHLNPEERKDYRCSFCHIMFDTVKLRERHEERHRDGEVFACESCGRVFKNEKNLTHHIKMHHVEKSDMKKQVEKKKEPPPKHHCHICGPPKLFCLTSLRRHLARIHSTNHKCPREKCGKCFKEKAQLDAHVEVHRLRECHICGKVFRRKQNADIHLLGVHHMSKADLERLGRWNPKKDLEDCPEYMTRKVNKNPAAVANMMDQDIVIKEEVDIPDYIVVGEVKDEDEELDDELLERCARNAILGVTAPM